MPTSEHAHAKAVNDQYRDLVTRWDMDEITAYDVHGEGKDIGMVHATLYVTGELICTFTVLLVTQMKDTCITMVRSLRRSMVPLRLHT